MEKDKTAVKAEEQKAAPAIVEEMDVAALLAAKDAELAQVRTEKENYKRGLLKAKGKIPPEDEADEKLDIEEIIDRKVSERMLSTKEAQIQADKDAIIKSAATKIKELTLALQNKGQMPKALGSASEEGKDNKAEDFWSAEQLAYFKKRKIDPNKAKENFLKAKNK